MEITHARFQFDKLSEWEQENVIKKQRQQEAMRQSLAEQVRLKQERYGESKSGTCTASDDSKLAPTNEFNWKTDERIKKRKEIEKQKRILDEQMSQKLQLDFTDLLENKVDNSVEFKKVGYEKLEFDWKREERIRKRKDIEKQRRILDEQVGLKAVRVSPRSPTQTNFSSSRSSLDRVQYCDNKKYQVCEWKQEEKLKKREEQEKTRRMLQEQIDAKQQISNSPTISPIMSPVCNIEVRTIESQNTEQVENNEGELQLLRMEVMEQKRLLEEQTIKMNELFQKASFIQTVNSSEDTLKSPEVLKRRVKPSNTKNRPLMRECELRRDASGKYRIEIDPLMDTCCLIKKIGKSYAKDERAVLVPGDMIVAIGGFSVKNAMQANYTSLSQVLDSDLPSVESIEKALKKGAVLVKMAVFSTSKKIVLEKLQAVNCAPPRIDPFDSVSSMM